MPRIARHRRSLLPLAFLAMLSLAAMTTDLSACPNCKNTLPNGQSAEGQPAEPQLAQGFAWSIYLMIAMPFGLVGILGGTVYVLAKKAGARQAMLARRMALQAPSPSGRGLG